MKILRYGVLLFFMTLSGCGTANTNAPSLDTTNKHPVNWLTSHRTAFHVSPVTCRECHGIDLKGGITKIDCFNQGALARCHANGHGPRAIIHALPFISPLQHGPLASTDLVICQDCHGTTGGAGSNPRFNILIGSLGNGCEASGCHLPKMAHPKSWKSHGFSGNQANACALCHGTSFGGGNGPACNTCHARLVAGSLPQAGQCVSCHGNPPEGAAYPDRAGSHAAHTRLPGISCRVCHNGFGTSSHSHYSTARVQQLHLPASIAFYPAFNAKSGAANFSSSTKTCVNVSCHGGQSTPVWGATLNAATDCLQCHSAGSTQYNGYVSGKHAFHLTLGLFCTDCHDMTSLAAPGHFSNLSSAALTQPAFRTIRSYLNYNRTAPTPTCFITTAPPPGTQFTACHSSQKSWQP